MYLTGIVNAFYIFLTYTSICWLICYSIFGTWLKVKLIRKFSCQNNKEELLYKPVIISNIAYSILFINPFMLFVAFCFGWWFIVLILIMGIILENFLWRTISNLKYFHFLRWRPSWKKAVLISIFVHIFTIFATFGLTYLILWLIY